MSGKVQKFLEITVASISLKRLKFDLFMDIAWREQLEMKCTFSTSITDKIKRGF